MGTGRAADFSDSVDPKYAMELAVFRLVSRRFSVPRYSVAVDADSADSGRVLAYQAVSGCIAGPVSIVGHIRICIELLYLAAESCVVGIALNWNQQD